MCVFWSSYYEGQLYPTVELFWWKTSLEKCNGWFQGKTWINVLILDLNIKMYVEQLCSQQKDSSNEENKLCNLKFLNETFCGYNFVDHPILKADILLIYSILKVRCIFYTLEMMDACTDFRVCLSFYIIIPYVTCTSLMKNYISWQYYFPHKLDWLLMLMWCCKLQLE